MSYRECFTATMPPAAWEANLKWIELCWSGDDAEVIGLLQAEQLEVGYPAQDTPEDDPKFKLLETIGYLQNNVSRMDYPAYRQAGLPTSSCLIESQVKEMNHRVKGSEKFWDDGKGGEAISQVRAAIISDGQQLHDHVAQRPGSQYTRQVGKTGDLRQPSHRLACPAPGQREGEAPAEPRNATQGFVDNELSPLIACWRLLRNA